MSEYRVLARAYRPSTFDDLVGQQTLVRALTNAFETGRIAHAFLLTGIRGIGKTTTARIIAKGLNCIGAEGDARQPTIRPCDQCANCQQIREDRHVDVLELDAASHTGVGDMRELIEASRYKPATGRYKVYIIDEAHMLSNSAFNALLKTLEEPPAHVVFILATTEIRKIPVTILSRCQRFDLRRLHNDELSAHLQRIAEKEQVRIGEDALELIAIAAEGSVRDALSLLDQAIAHSELEEGGGYHVSVETVRGLLGLVDRSRLYAMLEHLFAGECDQALALLQAQYQDGANMTVLVQDMMEAIHTLARMAAIPGYTLDRTFAEHEREMLGRISAKLNVPAITKAWQLLMKGLDEIKRAPHTLSATEMVFIRFAYAANLPDPAELIRQWQHSDGVQGQGGAPSSGGGSGPATLLSFPGANTAQGAPLPVSDPSVHPAPAPSVQNRPSLSLVEKQQPKQSIDSFEDILALCEQEREAILLHHLRESVRLVACQAGELVIGHASTLPEDKAQALKRFLHVHTGREWTIRRAEEEGEETLNAQLARRQEERIARAKTEPLIASILETFTDSTIVEISDNDDSKG